jgi:hypothetical protein
MARRPAPREAERADAATGCRTRPLTVLQEDPMCHRLFAALPRSLADPPR